MSSRASVIACPFSVSILSVSPVSRIFADGSDTVLPAERR